MEKSTYGIYDLLKIFFHTALMNELNSINGSLVTLKSEELVSKILCGETIWATVRSYYRVVVFF